MSFTFVISTNPYKSGFQTLFPEAQVSMKMPEEPTGEGRQGPGLGVLHFHFYFCKAALLTYI